MSFPFVIFFLARLNLRLVAKEPTSKLAGSYHWTFERLISFSLIPLGAATLIQGSGAPITDLILGVIVPIHAHQGFETILSDYAPKRRQPFLNPLGLWSLRLGTVLVLLGCYQFNTNDVGLTELIKRVWKA